MGRPLGSFDKAPDLSYITALQWSYLAGLIDGEGCISTHRKKGRYYGRITIGMTDKATILWVHQLLGGHVKYRNPLKLGWKGTWIWRTGGQLHVRFICRELIPYAITKKEHVILLGTYKPNEVLAKRITKLNKRGTDVNS